MSSRVAVITRTKNRNMLLPRAIESVLNQSYDNWHHVIVNDGGNRDDLEALLASYHSRYSNRLTVIHHEVSKGMEAASNAGIRDSSSQYIVIHDDDDAWDKDFLKVCVSRLESEQDSSVKGLVTGITQIHEQLSDGKFKEVRRQHYNPELKAISISQMMEVNPFLPIAFLFERAAYCEVGAYDESLPVIGDWEFNIRFLSRYDIRVIPEQLAFYYIRDTTNDEYQNSVLKPYQHEFYRAKLVNHHIRKDLHSGKTTIGQLLMMGDFLHRTNHQLNRVGQLLEKLKNTKLIRWLRKATQT